MLNINFIPPKKRVVKFEVDYFYWAFEFIILLVIVLIASIALSNQIKNKTNIKAEKEAIVQKNQGLLNQIKELEGKRSGLAKKMEIINKLDQSRQKWVKIVDVLCDIIPDQVWINSFSGRENSIDLSGTGLTLLYVNEFIKALKDQTDFVESITLKSINSGKVPQFAQPIQKFSLTITLKAGEVKK